MHRVATTTTSHARSARVAELRACFGSSLFAPSPYDIPPPAPVEVLAELTHLPPGSCGLITGASGSGKSTLLRAVSARFRSQHLPPLRQRAVIDHFGDDPLTDALGWLARVGLAEVPLLLRTGDGLSDGQRWRLRLALGLRAASRSRGALVIDEFASLLDPVSAEVVALGFARALRELGLAAVVATWRDELAEPLGPHVHVHCDFGRLEARGGTAPGASAGASRGPE